MSLLLTAYKNSKLKIQNSKLKIEALTANL